MNRDDIVRMAREQGLPETEVEGVFRVNSDDLGRMLAAEREACAQVGMLVAKNGIETSAAIRARGQPDPKVTHLNEWARDRLARHGIQLPDEDEEYGNPSF
jgi:hypothetical protein